MYENVGVEDYDRIENASRLMARLLTRVSVSECPSYWAEDGVEGFVGVNVRLAVSRKKVRSCCRFSGYSCSGRSMIVLAGLPSNPSKDNRTGGVDFSQPLSMPLAYRSKYLSSSSLISGRYKSYPGRLISAE